MTWSVCSAYVVCEKVFSAQVHALQPHIISVEVDTARGLHAFTVVGLPDKAVEESRDRVSSAIKHSGFESPKTRNQKIVISLAPADIKKEGPTFDVPIALAYLAAVDDIRFNSDGKIFLGELSLDGEVRKMTGVLPLIQIAKEKGFTQAFVPRENAVEAALVGDITIYPVETLRELIEHVNEKKEGENVVRAQIEPQPKTKIVHTREKGAEIADIRGQETAKRGLEIAAAGGHNVGLWGPPGTGKTLLAKACASIMPPLSQNEALEITGIHSVAGILRDSVITHPPFRSPHHTSSYVSLVGGGAIPKPGEITLAHRGVLFLDEFPEFDRRVIEALRQPLEERVVSVVRARGSCVFPADVMLIAALNPCPCGNWGSESKTCICPPQILLKYQRKLSGPLVDRIDMWLPVAPVPHEKLATNAHDASIETSEVIAKRVARARNIQAKRFGGTKITKNSEMGVKDIDTFAKLEGDASKILTQAAEKLDLSARGYHRVIKLARTIADLAESDAIEVPHILEAISYRAKTFLAS